MKTLCLKARASAYCSPRRGAIHSGPPLVLDQYNCSRQSSSSCKLVCNLQLAIQGLLDDTMQGSKAHENASTSLVVGVLITEMGRIKWTRVSVRNTGFSTGIAS